MLTDAMTRFLAEKALGWEPTGDEWRVLGMYPGRAFDYGHASTPDLASWEGFGLLLTALAKAGREPVIGHLLRPIEGWHVVIRSGGEALGPDPRVALALAAAKAYGYKEE